MSHIFRHQGIDTWRFVRKALTEGPLCSCMSSLFPDTDKRQHGIDMEIDEETLLAFLVLGDHV